MTQKVTMNGLTVEQKNGRTYVNGKDISDITGMIKANRSMGWIWYFAGVISGFGYFAIVFKLIN